MNYTAIGDAINLASRLEGLNKRYGSSIIASDTIVNRASEAFDFRLLDVVAVKGKSDPITIYELLGTKGALEHCRQVVSAYEKCILSVCSRKFRARARCPAGERERPSEHRVDRTVQDFLASAASRGLARNLRIGVEVDRGAHASPLHKGNTCFGSAPIGKRVYAARLKWSNAAG
jgi:hypothetical protein